MQAVEGQSFREDEDHADVELGLLRVGPDAGVTVEEAVGLMPVEMMRP
jgi:hypothetical protein